MRIYAMSLLCHAFKAVPCLPTATWRKCRQVVRKSELASCLGRAAGDHVQLRACVMDRPGISQARSAAPCPCTQTCMLQSCRHAGRHAGPSAEASVHMPTCVVRTKQPPLCLGWMPSR
jgi:hypothetical protein